MLLTHISCRYVTKDWVHSAVGLSFSLTHQFAILQLKFHLLLKKHWAKSGIKFEEKKKKKQLSKIVCPYVLVYLHDTKSVKKLSNITASSNFSFITSQPQEENHIKEYSWRRGWVFAVAINFFFFFFNISVCSNLPLDFSFARILFLMSFFLSEIGDVN